MAPDENGLRDLLDDIVHAVSGARVGLDANFFEAGLTSALMLQVHRRLGERLGWEPPVWALFKYPTRRTLARCLAAGPAGLGDPEPVTVRPSTQSTVDARRALRSQIRSAGRR